MRFAGTNQLGGGHAYVRTIWKGGGSETRGKQTLVVWDTEQQTHSRRHTHAQERSTYMQSAPVYRVSTPLLGALLTLHIATLQSWKFIE